MKSIIVISIVMVSILSLSCHSKDFCEAYAENGFKVDFPFQFIPPNGKLENIEWLLVIGNNYWIIDESENQTLCLRSDESKSSNLFKKGYKLGFSALNGTKYETGFLRKNEPTIDWIVFNDTKGTKVEDLTQRFTFRQTEWGLKGVESSKSVVLAVGPYVYIFEQKETNLTFERQYRWSEVNKLHLTGNSTQMNPPVATKNYPIVGIFVTKIANSSHIVILYAVNKTLQYCYANYHNLKDECLTTDLKVMIECQKRLELTTRPDTELDSRTVLLVIMGLLSLIGVILIVVIVTVCLRNHRRKQRDIKMETESQKTLLSEEGSITKQLKKHDGQFKIMAFKSDMNIGSTKDGQKKFKPKKEKK